MLDSVSLYCTSNEVGGERWVAARSAGKIQRFWKIHKSEMIRFDQSKPDWLYSSEGIIALTGLKVVQIQMNRISLAAHYAIARADERRAKCFPRARTMEGEI
jgi:hypothetical protein